MRRLFLILSLLLPVTVLVSGAASAETKLAATIFSYDGADFVRTQTTLTQDGKSAAGTKLDHDSAAYKALSQKQSYTGPATIMGQESRSRKSAQDDNWSFCLTAGTLCPSNQERP